MKVLVTGAEERHGLAVIRGLGLKGIPVVACGSAARSMGFYSRFATEHYQYPSPHRDRTRFIEAILNILDTSGATMVICPVESTLVVLDSVRSEIEKKALLAAPDSSMLEVTVDKLKTIELAHEVGVPVPKTIHASTCAEVIARIDELRFPVALKPRGSYLHRGLGHGLKFKVMYAETPERLRSLLEEMERTGGMPLVQEYATGVSICVASAFDHGRPLVHFPYQRLRELPITGGISVLRKSLPPNGQLNNYVDQLLGRLGWHGVAMVEFKYEEQTDSYMLMEINGRFQASTALALDAGVNLPWLQYALYSGNSPDPVTAYKVGLCERYLRGDVLSLLDYLSGDTRSKAASISVERLPSKLELVAAFLRGFRPGMKYDEFKTWDWRPALAEIGPIMHDTYHRLRSIVGGHFTGVIPLHRYRGRRT